jgi:hypothetical protein
VNGEAIDFGRFCFNTAAPSTWIKVLRTSDYIGFHTTLVFSTSS